MKTFYGLFSPLQYRLVFFLYVRSVQVMDAPLAGRGAKWKAAAWGWGESRREHMQNAEKN